MYAVRGKEIYLPGIAAIQVMTSRNLRETCFDLRDDFDVSGNARQRRLMIGEVSALIEHPEPRLSFVGGVLQVVTCSDNADTCPMIA